MTSKKCDAMWKKVPSGSCGGIFDRLKRRPTTTTSRGKSTSKVKSISNDPGLQIVNRETIGERTRETHWMLQETGGRRRNCLHERSCHQWNNVEKVTYYWHWKKRSVSKRIEPILNSSDGQVFGPMARTTPNTNSEADISQATSKTVHNISWTVELDHSESSEPRFTHWSKKRSPRLRCVAKSEGQSCHQKCVEKSNQKWTEAIKEARTERKTKPRRNDVQTFPPFSD